MSNNQQEHEAQPLKNGDDVQQMLEQASLIQMQEDCKVLNCKFLSQSVFSEALYRRYSARGSQGVPRRNASVSRNPLISEKIQLCEPCWVAYMFACNTFEKQYSMLEKYVPLEESKYIVKKQKVKRHRR